MAAVVLVAGFGGCSDTSSEVAMTGDLTFDPRTLVVEAGTTITFTNDSEQLHTVTAYEDRIPEGEFFTSGGVGSEAAARAGVEAAFVAPGDSFEVTLDKPGRYPYFCIPHESQGMKGTITVE